MDANRVVLWPRNLPVQFIMYHQLTTVDEEDGRPKVTHQSEAIGKFWQMTWNKKYSNEKKRIEWRKQVKRKFIMYLSEWLSE